MQLPFGVWIRMFHIPKEITLHDIAEWFTQRGITLTTDRIKIHGKGDAATISLSMENVLDLVRWAVAEDEIFDFRGVEYKRKPRLELMRHVRDSRNEKGSVARSEKELERLYEPRYT